MSLTHSRVTQLKSSSERNKKGLNTKPYTENDDTHQPKFKPLQIAVLIYTEF